MAVEVRLPRLGVSMTEGTVSQWLVEDGMTVSAGDQLYVLETDKVDAKAGGEFQLKVACTRRDYGGPVALSLSGLEPALLEGATIPVGKQETQLKVKLPGNLAAGSIVAFTVVGSATAGGEEVRATASTTSVWQSPAPAVRVSCMWAANESSALHTEAMPPCA